MNLSKRREKKIGIDRLEPVEVVANKCNSLTVEEMLKVTLAVALLSAMFMFTTGGILAVNSVVTGSIVVLSTLSTSLVVSDRLQNLIVEPDAEEIGKD